MNGKVEQTNDEIDLVDLVKTLWDKKWWIVLSAFICTTLAGIYAFTAQEQWTSKAEVVGPKTQDFQDYFQIRKEYQRIVGGELDVTKVSNSLFEKFTFFLSSLDERKNFFINSNYYKKLIENETEESARKILQDLLVKNTTIVKPDPKKNPDQVGIVISFVAESADSAQRYLKSYLAYINKKGFELELNHFLIYFNELISDLKYERLNFERDLNIQKNVQLENLNKAYDIAKSAEIKEYTKGVGSNIDTALQAMALSDTKIALSDPKLSDNTYLFMLGEKYLKAQIDVTEKNSTIYPPRYYKINELLKELEPLYLEAKNLKADTFKYLLSPDYPVQKDWPKRLLLLFIGVFLGGIIGVIFILAGKFFK